MANYYTQFSFDVPTKTVEHADWLTRRIDELREREGEDAPKTPLDQEIEDCGFGVDYQRYGDHGIILFSDESGNVEAVSLFLTEYLTAFSEIPDGIGFEWSGTCSKMRPDAFGGGACLVTRNGERYIDTSSWLSDEINELAGKSTATKLEG